MNSYQRVMRRINGENVDFLPDLSLVMTFAAKQIGVPYGKYVSDYRLLAKGALLCYEKFGLDMVCAISDPMRETEGFGAEVCIPEDDVPYSPVPRLKDISEIETLKIVDPSSVRRMNDRLEAIRFLKERVGQEAPVVGWVEGAVAESCDLMQMSEVLMNLLDEPEAMEELLSICERQAEIFAREQIKAGADIIGVGDAASSLIGPALYEEFALPHQQKLIQSIHEAGAKVKLHICGNLNPVLDLVAQTGADIIDLDYMVDMKKAAALFPKTSCICGNFDPVGILLQGNKEDVKREVKRCMEISQLNPNMISPGCEIPKNTPIENVLAIQEAIREGIN